MFLNHTAGFETRTITGPRPLGEWESTYTLYTLDTWAHMWQRPRPYTFYTLDTWAPMWQCPRPYTFYTLGTWGRVGGRRPRLDTFHTLDTRRRVW